MKTNIVIDISPPIWQNSGFENGRIPIVGFFKM